MMFSHCSLGLDYLSQHLPHTLVILMSVADVTSVLRLKEKPVECHVSHLLECPCLFGLNMEDRVKNLVDEYRWISSELKDSLKKFFLSDLFLST